MSLCLLCLKTSSSTPGPFQLGGPRQMPFLASKNAKTWGVPLQLSFVLPKTPKKDTSSICLSESHRRRYQSATNKAQHPATSTDLLTDHRPNQRGRSGEALGDDVQALRQGVETVLQDGRRRSGRQSMESVLGERSSLSFCCFFLW